MDNIGHKDSTVALFNNFTKLFENFVNLLRLNQSNTYEIKYILGRLPKTFECVLDYSELIANKLISMDKKLFSNSTNQEIAEIVNKAISSYNEINKQNIEEINKQSVEEINKRIDEVNKQNNEESKLYYIQIIQMFKDLTENVNKLNNKVDRLESISQKKEEVIKVDTQTTTIQPTMQISLGGLRPSKKVHIRNVLEEYFLKNYSRKTIKK